MISKPTRKIALAGALAALLLPGGSAPAGPVPQPAASVYAQRCARCHGASGKGDGPAAAALAHKPHSLRDCEWMSMMSNATLFLAIKSGPGAIGADAAMPGYGDTLNDSEIGALVGYVRGFCEAPERSANPP